LHMTRVELKTLIQLLEKARPSGGDARP
jgi:hypothetical protein